MKPMKKRRKHGVVYSLASNKHGLWKVCAVSLIHLLLTVLDEELDNKQWSIIENYLTVDEDNNIIPHLWPNKTGQAPKRIYV